MKSITPKMATLASFCYILNPLASTAQSGSLHDHNTIGWYQVNTTTNLGTKWGFHADYNQRYEPLQVNLFQRLIRTGINFNPAKTWHLRAGYVWVENIPYGDFPSNSEGNKTNEHRLYQMVAYKHGSKTVEVRHRVITEQRWLERNAVAGTKNSSYVYANRIRYQLKTQFPVKWKFNQTSFPYLQFYDEIMVAYGKNIPSNRYDQNRIGVLAGYHFSKYLQLEAGLIYINQQLQRKLNNQTIYLHNTGLQLNLYAQIDASKKVKGK